MTRFERFVVTAGGLGLLRPASGSWGSLPPPLLAIGMAALSLPGWQIDAALALLGVAFAIGCVRFGAAAESVYGKKDPGRVVADEVAGQSLALLLLPWPDGDLGRTALIAGVGFLFFRVCDIAKPWPAHRLQRLAGGWGILVDDLVAGLYAAIATQLVVRTML